MEAKEAGKRIVDIETRMRSMEAQVQEATRQAAANATNLDSIAPAFLEILAVGLLGMVLYLGWQTGAALLEQPHCESHGSFALRRRSRARTNSTAVTATITKAEICCQSMRGT